MALNLILNSSNVIGNDNSTYRYNFSGGCYTINPESEICVSAIQYPFSFFNINKGLYNNNTIRYIWNSATPQTFTLVLPDGYYSVTDLNNALEQSMILNGCYLYNPTTGNNAYFIQFLSNAVYYSNQLFMFSPPLNLAGVPSGYTVPSNWVGYAAVGPDGVGYVPQINFPSSGSICALLGFLPSTTFPPSLTDKAYNVLSAVTPNIATVNSLVVQCSLVNNQASNVSTILDSFPIGNTSFGYNINYSPPYEKWISIAAGTYQTLDVFFTDQNLGRLQSNDSNVLISLLLKQGKRRIEDIQREKPKISSIDPPKFVEDI